MVNLYLALTAGTITGLLITYFRGGKKNPYWDHGAICGALSIAAGSIISDSIDRIYFQNL